MTLRPGFRIAVAPNFHLAVDWSARIRLNGGVNTEGGRLFARPDWRPADADELAMLAFDPAAPDDGDEGAVNLFRLPAHLMSAWWEALESVEASDGVPGGVMERFFAAVSALLAYKETPVPPGAKFQLVVGRPGERSSAWGPRLGAAGLAINPVADAGRRWGGINLGDEPVSLMLVNLRAAEMSSELSFPSHPAHSPDCPVVSLTIHPGEGYRLPPGILFDGRCADNAEADVHLLIDAPAGAIAARRFRVSV